MSNFDEDDDIYKHHIHTGRHGRSHFWSPVLYGTFALFGGIGIIIGSLLVKFSFMTFIFIFLGIGLAFAGGGILNGYFLRKKAMAKRYNKSNIDPSTGEPVEITYWNCKICKTENDSEHIHCWKCNEPKPRDSDIS